MAADPLRAVENECNEISELDSPTPFRASEVHAIYDVVERDIQPSTTSDRTASGLHLLNQIKGVLIVFMILICYQERPLA